eukprot:5335805-Amphidinium_carterae.1
MAHSVKKWLKDSLGSDSGHCQLLPEDHALGEPIITDGEPIITSTGDLDASPLRLGTRATGLRSLRSMA